MKLLPKDYAWEDGEYELLKKIYMTWGTHFPRWYIVKDILKSTKTGLDWTEYEKYNIMTDNGYRQYRDISNRENHLNTFYPEFIEYIAERG